MILNLKFEVFSFLQNFIKISIDFYKLMNIIFVLFTYGFSKFRKILIFNLSFIKTAYVYF